jgi:hypothetical protein
MSLLSAEEGELMIGKLRANNLAYKLAAVALTLLIMVYIGKPAMTKWNIFSMCRWRFSMYRRLGGGGRIQSGPGAVQATQQVLNSLSARDYHRLLGYDRRDHRAGARRKDRGVIA